jgi:hypothetical protein
MIWSAFCDYRKLCQKALRQVPLSRGEIHQKKPGNVGFANTKVWVSGTFVGVVPT